MTSDAVIYTCTAISADFGATDKKPIATARIVVRIDEGPMMGQRVTYEEEVNARSAKYIGWACSAVGWAGKTLNTLKDDCAAWIAKTGGVTTVEIKPIVTRKGTPDEGIWQKPTAIGKGAARPLKPVSPADLKDADEAMRAAMGGAPGDAPSADDDIPFLTCTVSALNPIAKVLR